MCTCTGTPPGLGLPSWLETLLISVGATNCFDAAKIAAIEADLNARGYVPERDSFCVIRPRLYQGTFGTPLCGHPMVDFAQSVTTIDILAANGCDWAWLPAGTSSGGALGTDSGGRYGAGAHFVAGDVSTWLGNINGIPGGLPRCTYQRDPTYIVTALTPTAPGSATRIGRAFPTTPPPFGSQAQDLDWFEDNGDGALIGALIIGADSTGTHECGDAEDIPLSVSCPTGTGHVGTAYASALAGAGGTPGYTYAITAGLLPPGLALNTGTGAVTGTPTTIGTYNITSEVTDSLGDTAVHACTISISGDAPCTAPPGAPVIGAPLAPNRTLGE